MPSKIREEYLTAELVNADATLRFGKQAAEAFKKIDAKLFVVFMEGNLGMGKTCFCQGMIAGMGHQGRVKSPTYTLVEPYELESVLVSHFDLYRLADPEELEFMGGRDYFSPSEEESGSALQRKLCLIEWPEKGRGYLPGPDLEVRLSMGNAVDGNGAGQERGRIAELSAHTPAGQQLLEQLRC